jgi:hypothetical protein
MVPKTRQEFIDKCLRNLGAPTVEINLDEDQIGDRIDDALDKYWMFHFNGVEKLYMKYKLTAGDIANNYVPVPTNVRSITRILPIYGNAGATVNMFDVRYQYMLSNLPNFTSLTLADYEITMMHLENINMAFNGIPGIRFNYVTHKLYLDIDWKVDVIAGQYIIIECTSILDPDTYPELWADAYLLKYATALLKRQWGTNMKKFDGVQLPGGITMNGQKIYDESIAELELLELEMENVWSDPPNAFIMG